ncbi:MAG: hypothetical protein HYS86_04315 [Candidatus Chisholmbacteria bacterium]|nr:hypothetical protein [Candidatus Chisholmbacteria bacterium]
MATLTETAYYARRIIKFGGIGLVVFIIGRFFFFMAVDYWRLLHPPPPPPPTVAFGRLPQLVFPEKTRAVESFLLETVSGGVAEISDRATIFFMPVRQANLLALERMSDQAAKLGFTNEPEQVSSREYRWRRDSPLPATLTADIVSASFTLEVEWQLDPTILDSGTLPNSDAAVQEARRFLDNAGLLPSDLAAGETKVSFLRADIANLVSAVSLSEADFVRVDFFRTPVEEWVVYPSNPQRGVVAMIFSGNPVSGKRIIDIKYNYFPVDYEQSATYPLKTAQVAWQELQAGQGYIANVDSGVTRATVRRVALGYYDSAIPQNYLQPIYVFEGDNNFVAYVPAIPTQWVDVAQE